MKRDIFTQALDLGAGIARTRTIWRGMRARCTNPKHISYSRYGAIGVTICDQWQSFDRFLADMGPAPKGLSIERLDGALPYQPGNCVWATPKEQARNRSNNVLVEHAGQRRTIAEWAELHGLKVGTLWRRLQRVSIDVALTRQLIRGKPLTGKQKPRTKNHEA